jgi:hypothetical protein
MFPFGRDMFRRALIALGIALAAGSGSCVPPDSAPPLPVKGAPGTARPEEAWLSEVGSGPEQTARVCRRGAKDRVATVLCGPQASSIRSLADLYRALGLDDPEKRDVASTTHSLALSARIVSAANPRTFVFTKEHVPIPFEHLVVTAFSRGEQFVELVALDPATIEYNFYLLRFEQACNLSRCTPEDLLTEKIESGWTGSTLYVDRDLEDTPLDCLSCHLPFGAGTHKQLSMRQTAGPWMHWGDFKGAYEDRICYEQTMPYPGRWIPADGLELMTKLEGTNGRHGAVPVQELVAAPSGERFSLFLTEAENTIRASSYPAGYPYAQVDFSSSAALCEWLQTGKRDLWEKSRKDSLARGLPVPYHSPDVTDPGKRSELLADRAGFLARHAAEDPFDVAMSLWGTDAATAVGFVPRPDDTAEQLLHEMCVRCHAASVDRKLKRARFNAESLERIGPDLADRRPQAHQSASFVARAHAATQGR